jgi:hypothetical protein
MEPNPLVAKVLTEPEPDITLLMVLAFVPAGKFNVPLTCNVADPNKPV